MNACAAQQASQQQYRETISANDRESAFLARCGLILLAVGLLTPPIIAAIILASSGPDLSPVTENAAASLSFGFGFFAQALALILGIVGRRHLAGRIARRGASGVLVLAVALMVVWSFLGGTGHRRPPSDRPPPVMTKSRFTIRATFLRIVGVGVVGVSL
jgi:hypothetical protein